MATSHRIARRRAAVLIALLVAAVSGCGSETTVSSTNGRTVPVLWAGRTAAGDPVSGIEPATVDVRTDTEARYEVLLDSIEAKGAGSTWLATSALAAALATLNAGVDPRLVDVDFEITGPIDGPSGGAILTIGTLASMRGDPLRTDITMTGTISPDGTIGMVGEIPSKIEAAADAGYRTVLVPAGAANAFPGPHGSGAAPDLAAFGSSLGVTVIEVGHLDEAYTAFTGATISPPGQPSVALAPEVRSVVVDSTAELVSTCRTVFDSLPPDIDQVERDRLDEQVARLEEVWARGDLGAAYGLGIDTLQNLRRTEARHDVVRSISMDGLDAAWRRLGDEVDRLLEMNAQQIDSLSDTARLGVEQVLSLPFALGWFTYEAGVLSSLRARLDGPADAALGETFAAAIGQSESAITTFGPDAVAVVRASSSEPTSEPVALAEFISGYVDFIGRAASATADYARVAELDAPPTDPIAVLDAMISVGSAADVGDDPVRAAVLDLADAATRFVLAETIASGRSFGLGGFGIGADPTVFGGGAGLLSLSVRSGVQQARQLGASLVENGSGLDYVLWQAELAEGIHETLRDTDRAGAGGVIALNELWYAVINAQMVSASRNAVRFS